MADMANGKPTMNGQLAHSSDAIDPLVDLDGLSGTEVRAAEPYPCYRILAMRYCN